MRGPSMGAGFGTPVSSRNHVRKLDMLGANDARGGCGLPAAPLKQSSTI